MKLHFNHKKIAGMLCVLPKEDHYFDDEIENYPFPEKNSLRLKRTMGYEKHRVVKETTSTYDFCKVGVQKLLDDGKITKDNVGAIIVVTVTPDHFQPHVSNAIQGDFGFPEDVFCMDVLQGCCGFEYALMQAFMLLEHLGDKKVLVVNADTLSKKVSKQDRNSYPIVGDCAALTLVENCQDDNPIILEIKADGAERDALIIPAGGSRLPCSAETAIMKPDADGNIRCLDNLVMDGLAVFNFAMKKVPGLIDEIYSDAGKDRNDTEYFLFHQPNEFMLRKLSQLTNIPREKIFSNIVKNFGNPSGASIPLVTAFNIGDVMVKDEYHSACICAFGSGLNYAAILMNIGKMNFCEIMEADV